MSLHIWDFSQSSKLEGLYIGRYASVGAWKKPVHTFKLDDKSTVHVWGSVMLNHLLYGVPFGSRLKITYMGKEKTEESRHPIHIYEVEVVEVID